MLNDLDICIDCINMLLASRQLPILDTDRYRQIFTFPVKEYYIKAGFDLEKEPFDVLAVEFIDRYKDKIPDAALFPAVINALKTFKRMGVKQYIVSAMEQEFLRGMVSCFNLSDYFEEIHGITDHFAESKTNIADHLIRNSKLEKPFTWFIGDTLHDFEVANETGINCVLVNQGHQANDRLQHAGCPVVSNLDEVVTYFFNKNLKSYLIKKQEEI